MRGINSRFINDLTMGSLSCFLNKVKQDKRLCLEIRKHFINIYYKGGNVLRIRQTKDGYRFEFDENYCLNEETRMKVKALYGLEDYRDNFSLLLSEMDSWFYKYPQKEREIQHELITFNTFDFCVLDIEYAGSYDDTCGKRILHTGDFRLHGFRGKAVIPTLKKYVGIVDILITDGTSLSRENTRNLDEAELQMLAKLTITDSKYVFALCSSTNIDRIAAFYHATPKGKYFLCDEYQKKVLDVVTKHAKGKTPLYNFEKVVTYGDNLDEKLHAHGFCMIVRSNNYFKRIMDKFPNAIFLYSMWDGYTNGKYVNGAIAHFTSLYDFQPFHTSGHASKTEIKLVCDTVRPRIGIIPIHSDSPKQMYTMNISFPILHLEDKEPFAL